MEKDIIIESRMIPNRLGYLDTIVVLDSAANRILYHGDCRVPPNPFRPSDGASWEDSYGFIACTNLEHPIKWECRDKRLDGSTIQKGKVLVFNGFGPVVTRNPNPNQSGRFYATGVYIHRAENKDWPGSAACVTKWSEWKEFIDLFEIGEKGNLQIVDFSKMIKA